MGDGLRLLSETRNGRHSLYLYDEGSYDPLARVDGQGEHARLRYYHTDPNGLPQQLTEDDGRCIWQARYQVWGNTLAETQESFFVEEQNLRFQGQYLDRETGLHYNTFRFYDPDIGRFISPDPIGLAGGINLFQYAPEPYGWVDPWGWKGCSVKQGDGKTHDIVLELTRKQYKQAFGHIQAVIKKTGLDIFTINRAGAARNRKSSLSGYPTKKGKDRDEFPMAMFKEGGKGASVRYIDPSDNRGAGSSISHALDPYPDGTTVKITVK
uniref:RHS domain-containing protein n=1 Tax=Pseudomonas chaetocerotis TaxID=2758695 RepID=A0A931CZZ2_9PSED